MKPLCKLGLVQVTDSGAGEEGKGAVNVYEPLKPSRTLLFESSQRLLARCVIISFIANHSQLASALQFAIIFSYFNSLCNHGGEAGEVRATFLSLQPQTLRLSAPGLLRHFAFVGHFHPFNKH